MRRRLVIAASILLLVPATGLLIFSKVGVYEATPHGPRGVETPRADAPPPVPHAAGPHGGPILRLGDDLTAEIVWGADVLDLYILGPDGGAPSPIVPDAEPVVRLQAARDALDVRLEPVSDSSDFDGTHSHFRGALPNMANAGSLRVEVEIFLGGLVFSGSTEVVREQ